MRAFILYTHTHTHVPHTTQGYDTYILIFYVLVGLIGGVLAAIAALTFLMRRQVGGWVGGAVCVYGHDEATGCTRRLWPGAAGAEALLL